MQNSPHTPIQFPCGAQMKNRFMLAPMTNQQSHEDGQLSEDEFHWLTMRAKGQFGLVMTCAAHVQSIGKGFSGQLGIYDNIHIEGHQRLSSEIKMHGSLAVIQLHHAGMRSPETLIEESPVCPSAHEKYGARALSLTEVIQLREDFISAAVRAQKSGYDGIEVHGAHGYILSQFLSPEINLREDAYGGSLENRSRLLLEIVEGIRAACGDGFLLGVRLSLEKFGLTLDDTKLLCQRLINEGKIDFLDISLWDCFKKPEDAADGDILLLDHFLNLEFKNVLLTVAGKIRSGSDVTEILNKGVDFVTIGRSGILHHDFPQKVIEHPSFEPKETPVSRAYLKSEGLGENFIDYMSRWKDFVIPE